MIVMKFGGSSVESAKAVQRVAAIVRNHLDRQPVVVVSAMGKTTDCLLGMGRLAAMGNRETAGRELAKLRRFHLTEAASVTHGAGAVLLCRQIREIFDELEETLDDVTASGTLDPRLSDAIASVGERLSSLIVTAGFRQAGIDAVHLDARDAIVTDGRPTHAAPLFIETNAALRRKVSQRQITVMGGFIGAAADGTATTLGRGGSDYTAAIVVAALSVDEIQIWTDVDGMLTCDPRVVPGAHCLRAISFAEAEQMALSGAKVLHPATVAPAVRQGIPIAIRNSRDPGAAGTRISADHPCDGAVMSIACRSGIAMLRLVPRNTPVTGEFGREIWDAPQEAGAEFELVATSSRELTVVVDAAALSPELRGRLGVVAEGGVEDNCALVTLVGHNVARHASNLARASQALHRMPGGAILACCADSRFAFVVCGDALRDAAAKLHTEFFGRPDPAFFVENRASVTVMASAPAKARLVGVESRG